MGREKNKSYRSSGIVWLWLIFLAFLLILIKFFFIGTYYIEGDSTTQKSLIIVSIQSKPKVEGDIILIELTNGELAPAGYISHTKENCKVRIGGEEKWIKTKMIKGKMIKSFRL